MRTKVLVTNGGPHSADDLALATAEQITDMDPNITDDRKIAVQKLRLELADILCHYHRLNQKEERDRLQNGLILDSDELTQLAFLDVLDTTSHSPWHAHYQKPEVQQVIRYIINKDLSHSRHIERDWHRDAKESL